MSTITKCTCGHLISEHTYSENTCGCDIEKCECQLDLGLLIDKYAKEASDRIEQNLKDAKRINELLLSVDGIVTDRDKIEANYDALQSPMACGHLARYAITSDEGVNHCLLCMVISMAHTDNIKIISEIAEIINHE